MPNVTDITYCVLWQFSGCNTKQLLYSYWKAVSMNCGCLFLSTVSPLVESYKQGGHSALASLSSRCKLVGSAFLQDTDVL